MLSVTTYVIVSNMIADTYRYEEAVKKANEKLRLVGVVAEDGLYYGVRNVALMSIVIRELGVVDINGVKHVLENNVELKPGDTLISKSNMNKLGTIYAVTARGNVFTAPIINLPEVLGTLSFDIVGLIPAYTQTLSPLTYFSQNNYTVGMSVYSYVFGYVIADDPHSDTNVQAFLGPYNVAKLYKAQSIPLTTYTTDVDGNLSLTAKFIFEISTSRAESILPHYKITMPIEVRREDEKSGLIMHGCVGIIWRTISNNIYGISAKKEPITVCKVRSDFKACETIGTYVVPSALDVKQLVTYLAQVNPQLLPLEAPSGSQTYIIFTRCFTLESDDITEIKTTENRPWDVIYGFKVYTYLVFPGRNRYNSGVLFTYAVPLKLEVDPKIFVQSLLTQI